MLEEQHEHFEVGQWVIQKRLELYAHSDGR